MPACADRLLRAGALATAGLGGAEPHPRRKGTAEAIKQLSIDSFLKIIKSYARKGPKIKYKIN